MITAEELEKLAELKDRGIITEDEFNAKRDEFLGQSSNKNSNTIIDDEAENEDTSSGSNIVGWIVGVLIVVLSSYYLSDGSSSSGNSGAICGNYARASASDWTGLLYDHFGATGKESVTLKFPTYEVAKKWDKYDRQRICVDGNIREESSGNYYIYNPRFVGYQ